MPRPTPAQLAYGSASVVLSTFALLLLSQARSAPWVGVIAVAGLLLGLLVAVTGPFARAARAPHAPRGSRTIRTNRPRTGTPAHASAERAGVGEHSFHG
ncbi:hypothetical protein HUT19_25670 [Streptomyces sp. NA02950]|uniref:hypothetical protein n=1 Tax=Streptomyces sp. NA02950 TaxID=2742137 RepID=UPI001590FBDB|nr:hypothetical protein [Streptomyces sp. NA02950]QKV94721.1 hypothetical protein HUT19_25670 [Streptomyces sp. NA02950]